LNLQVVVYPLYPTYLGGELLGSRSLIGRLDYTVQGDHSIGRIDIDTSEVGGFVAY
jgi:hypothetical protein